jgi:RNA polymerase sigma factor (sigma-70 family)
MTPADTDALFREYRRTRDPATRDRLVGIYRPYALKIAAVRATKLPASVMDVDEACASALIGLWHAVERYDPADGAKFGTYAAHRIHGQISDDVRQRDWRTRFGHQRAVASGEPYAKMQAWSNDGIEQHGWRNLLSPAADAGPEADDAFRGLIAKLSRRERLVATLYYADGLRIAEVAQAVGMSPSSIANTLESIRERLRATLAPAA